ncbi:pentapeptide repeat-containing protein [Youxingia wuxianensis]|uniref:Pentapeptide repeat-containing protein n=1 Tax=Youxingia wuxianensis TaxID=2763678 RepID=A0A926IG83_9FIRM|nr:pentapeptide repeat-containing protein [Youxingia wuxianensis]
MQIVFTFVLVDFKGFYAVGGKFGVGEFEIFQHIFGQVFCFGAKYHLYREFVLFTRGQQIFQGSAIFSRAENESGRINCRSLFFRRAVRGAVFRRAAFGRAAFGRAAFGRAVLGRAVLGRAVFRRAVLRRAVLRRTIFLRYDRRIFVIINDVIRKSGNAYGKRSGYCK